MKKFYIFFFIIFLTLNFSKNSNAECILPVPDMHNEYSPANIAGTILEKSNEYITIKNNEGLKKTIISNEATVIITEFGGLAEITQGTKILVWYQDCKDTSPETPVAAYIILKTEE